MKRSGFKRHETIGAGGFSWQAAKRKKQRKKPAKTKYAKRERAPHEWWIFVKSQRCVVVAMELRTLFPGALVFVTPCEGVIEADHAGRRGISQKAADNTSIPICTGHHRERGDFAGTFRNFSQANMRVFLLRAIDHTHDLALAAGIEIPSC